MQARDRAAEVFAQLRVWDTRANNGVLLYLLLADHRIEIVADRGFDGLVSAEQWRGVCQLIEERLQGGRAEAAVLRGVEALSALLAAHFPARRTATIDDNELPDLPHVLLSDAWRRAAVERRALGHNTGLASPDRRAA